MQFSTEARCGPGKIVEPMNAEVRVKCIQDHASFRSLEHGWNGLLQESTANTIFLTWEWLYTWFRHLNGDRRLCILSISQGEETIGLIPRRQSAHLG